MQIAEINQLLDIESKKEYDELDEIKNVLRRVFGVDMNLDIDETESTEVI